MKRIVLGTAATLFAIVPVLAFADCGPDHATMASSSADKKPALAQAGKTPATATTKPADPRRPSRSAGRPPGAGLFIWLRVVPVPLCATS